jgi:PAS domain S-box-containing protein
MKMDRQTKIARNPAKSKTDNSKSNGSDTGKKPDRSIARTKTANAQLPAMDAVQEHQESIGSRQRLLATYEYAPIGITECSLEGKYVNVNEEFCRITGYGKEELLTRTITDLTYEEDYIFDIKLHQRLITGEIPFYKLEKRLVRKDGKIIWAEVTRSLVRDPDGKPLYTIGAVLDVSERRQVEQALRESEARLAVELADAKKLQNVSSQLIQEDNINALYEQILDAAITLMRSEMGSIQVFYPEKNELRLLACKGFDPASASFWEWVRVDSNSTCGVALNRRERVIVPDVETCDFVAGTDDLDFYRLSGIRAVQSTPLFSRSGRIVGMISTHWRQPRQLSERDLRLLDVLARQAADLIERTQAQQASTEFARQQEALYKLADRLHRTSSLEDVFNAALDAILSALQCDRASILICDNAGVMRFAAWRGLSDSYRQAAEGHSPWKPDEKNPEPICINEIGTAELIDSLKAVIAGEGIGSLAFIPLVSTGRLIGKFMVYFNAPHVFSEGELDLSLTIARQLAFGIDRKRAEEALRESEEKYRTLFDSIDEGFCIIKKLDSRAGQPLDFRYIVANPAFAAQSGVGDVVGKTIRQAFPGEPEEWFETYDTILTTGEAIRFERGLVTQGRVLELYAFRVEDETHRRVAVIFKDITERKQAEEALRASEALYRAIARSIPGGGVYVVDKNFRYLVAEGPVTEAFGLSRELLEGHTVSEVFNEQASVRMEEHLRRNFAGETLSYETKHNGHVYWTQQAPLQDSIGHAIVVTIDITEQKQAEQALLESKERYRSLFDLVPVAVYTCDAKGLIQEYNHRAVELWGRELEKNDPKEKYSGSFKLYYPDGRFMPHEECPMARILGGQTLEPHQLEMIVERPDGVRRNVIAHPLLLKNEHGEIVEAINCLYDITERKQAEDALRQLTIELESRVQERTVELQAANRSLRQEVTERKQAEELLRRWAHIFEHADWGIATVRDDIFVMVNPTIAKMHGYTAEELVGRSIYDVSAPESQAHMREQIRIAYENGHHIFESRQVRRDGSIFPVLMDTTVVRDQAGNVLYRAVNVQDITERKRVEQELHESRERLQILSRRLVEVQEDERRAIARELHDRVGQTLAALNINLIIMNGQLMEDSKQRIGSRLDDSMHLVAEAISLVRNVMSDLRPAVLDDYGLEAALQSYIDQYKSRYNINVVLDPSDQPIPRLGPSLEMTILRIAQEALANVARHAHADLVNVSLRLQDDTVHLMVRDNGVGIQSWPEANRQGSHGLRIMHERADAFGGSLDIASAPGKGTKVEARIPFQNGNQDKLREEKR